MASLRVNVTVPLLISIVENEKYVSKVPGCGGWLVFSLGLNPTSYGISDSVAAIILFGFQTFLQIW